MRMLALHQYLTATTIDHIDTKRLASELKPLGYSLGRLSGYAAAGNCRLWLYGPDSATNDSAAVALLLAQAKRVRVDLIKERCEYPPQANLRARGGL